MKRISENIKGVELSTYRHYTVYIMQSVDKKNLSVHSMHMQLINR